MSRQAAKSSQDKASSSQAKFKIRRHDTHDAAKKDKTSKKRHEQARDRKRAKTGKASRTKIQQLNNLSQIYHKKIIL